MVGWFGDQGKMGVVSAKKSALWPCVTNFTWGEGGEHFGVLGPVYIMPCYSVLLSIGSPHEYTTMHYCGLQNE